MIVKETISFERGKEPKDTLDLGIKQELRDFFKGHPIMKIDINELNPDSLMAQCARFGELQFVKYCCEKLGADPKWDNCWGFRWAAENGHFDVVKYLVENYDIDINASRGWALRFAADRGHKELVQYLLDHGAKPNINNGQALKWASTQEIRDLIKKYNKDI